MIGTIFNACMILLGSFIGSLFKKGLPDKYEKILFEAMGLAATGIGINAVVSNMPKSKFPVLFIVSLALGSVIGTFFKIEERFQNLTKKAGGKKLSEGLSTAVLLFCIGTLSILGPIMSALNHDYTYLFTNGTLDFVTSIVLATSYGIGISFAAPILFCWQGLIYVTALFFGDFMSKSLFVELSVVGGFLIAASGLNILKLKQFKIMNMLPALLIPVLFFLFKSLFFRFF